MPEGAELAKVYADVLAMSPAREPAEQFFSSVTARKQNSRLILDLFFGQADAVIVYRSFFEVAADLNPQIRQQLAVLESYPVRSKNFAFFHRDYPYTGLVLPVPDRFAASPRGQQVLEIFESDKLTTSTVSDLVPIIELDKDYLQLSQHHRQKSAKPGQ